MTCNAKVLQKCLIIVWDEQQVEYGRSHCPFAIRSSANQHNATHSTLKLPLNIAHAKYYRQVFHHEQCSVEVLTWSGQCNCLKVGWPQCLMKQLQCSPEQVERTFV
jgi:hypothetical protein